MAAITGPTDQPQQLNNPDAFDAPVAGAPTPYIRRKIDVIFQIGTGDFGEAGKNVVTLRGKRCSATISMAQVGAPVVLNLSIWGMQFSQMQQLATLGRKFDAQRDNRVQIEAGDDLVGMTRVFTGTIIDAYFDGTSQPDVAFRVTANEAFIAALKPAPPISVAGAADVATMMAGLARQMGVPLEDHGVTVKLRDVYYPGTAMQQMRRIAEHAGINAAVENGVLAIWPRGTGRDTGTVPLITPQAGMKDYPTFNQMGVIVSCLFRVVQLGQKVAIKSSLWDYDSLTPGQKASLPASTRMEKVQYYFVYTYTYTLESEMPNGPWFSTFMASAEPLSS